MPSPRDVVPAGPTVAVAAGYGARPRRGILSLLQLLLSALFHTGLARGAPLLKLLEEDEEPKNATDPQLWIYLGTAIALVLLGGAFAGLTIALMGQDEVYLQVIAVSGEGAEKKNATKVLRLLKRGKHWVLVTLLVGNVITNETLPIVLDRSIGGGYAAAISSTVLVIIFGEIVPQSVCVRFGLPIGAWMANFVLGLMWIFAPITWPIAKLLDRILGEDHGTTYKKAGLKTLVTLHKTMGEAGADRLNEDEVAIISGVLDLKAKSVGSIMTPMQDVFVLSADDCLDEEMMDEIMREGYSRIPIHEPKNKGNFVGMLLVKMLITYDPEDAKRVSDFSLATLPETLPNTSCLDIINFFQEGKSHMVLVSEQPGEDHGALGVVTLEDVIEELIGEEIIDESDVFVDVHKAIRRMQPAPTHRARILSRGSANEFPGLRDTTLIDISDGKDEPVLIDGRQATIKRGSIHSDVARSPHATTFTVRRRSSTSSPSADGRPRLQQRQYTTSQMKQQLKNLGPSNLARQPKATRISAVKVKPGVGTIPELSTVRPGSEPTTRTGQVITPLPTDAQEGIGRDIVSPGRDASDGTQAVQQTYGSCDRNGSWRGRSTDSQDITAAVDGRDDKSEENGTTSPPLSRLQSRPSRTTRTGSHSTIGSIGSGQFSPTRRNHNRHGSARSGSITENIVDRGGVKKLVLEATSSSEEDYMSRKDSGGGSGQDGDAEPSRPTSSRVKPGEVVDGNGLNGGTQEGEDAPRASGSNASKKKKRKNKRNKDGGDENTPLLRRGGS